MVNVMRAKASAAFPENTLASFERAFRDGAEGIESGECYCGHIFTHLLTRAIPRIDVHVSLDDVVVMFHDPSTSASP